MALEKTEALVLRAIKFGETSRILTFLTRDFGQVKAIGKGVRAARPRFGGALEPFSRLELVVYLKEGRDLQIIGQADLVEACLPLSDDVRRYAFACAVAEFLALVTGGGHGVESPAPLFEEAVTAFSLLAVAPPDTLPYLLRGLQLRAALLLGHEPELAACVVCAGARGEPTGLAPSAGGVICPACARETPGVMPLSPGARAVLRGYRDNPLTLAVRQRLEPPIRAEVGRAMEAFMLAQLPGYHGLKSMKLAAHVRG